ncbi:MAG: hypothetical protein WC284_13920 [Candidimonas sp.]
MTVIWEGRTYKAVDLGENGGRFGVVENDKTILMTINGSDEKTIAVETAKALDSHKHSLVSVVKSSIAKFFLIR